MTTSKEKLKKYFEDGEVPTGENFSTLIDSLVHVDVFRTWRETGEIDLANGDWRVYVDSHGRFVVDPDKPSKSRPALALWHDGGWVGMQGRIGTYDQALDAACKSEPSELQVPLNARADGKWQPVLNNLEGCSAFELVARVVDPSGSNKQGITRAVALTSKAGSDLSIQQAPAHRGLRRNLVTLVLLGLFVALILGLPQKYVEKGRAGNEAVKRATEQVERSKAALGDLTKSLSSDVILLYTKPHYGGGDPVVIDRAQGIVNVKDGQQVKSIDINFPERLQITIYPKKDAKGTPTILDKDAPVVSDKDDIKSVRATVAPAYQHKIDLAQTKLNQAEVALEKAEQSPILPRFVERFVAYAKPAGLLGVIAIALSLLVSHWRHRAAIRVKLRKHRNKLIGGDAKYDLCLRTGRNYGVDANGVPIKIYYHITKLWE